MRIRIASKWAFLVLSIVLVLIFTGGAWFLQAEEREARVSAEGELTSVVSLKAGQIGDWRADQLHDASLIASDPVLTERLDSLALTGGAESESALTSLLEQKLEEHDYFDLMIVNGDGLVLASMRSPAGGTDTRLDDAMQEQLLVSMDSLAPVAVDLHRHAGDSLPHFSVIVPLADGAGVPREPFLAMIFVNDASGSIYPITGSWPTASRTAETVLLRRDGDSVLFLSDLRHRPGSAMDFRIPLAQTGVVEVLAALGGVGVIEGEDYRGEKVLAVASPVPGSSWILLAKVDESEWMAGWRSRAGPIAALIISIAILICLGGLLLWQRERKEHFEMLYRSEALLRASVERHSITLKAIGDAVISTDLEGRVDLINPVAVRLTGFEGGEATGLPVGSVFRIIDEETREPIESPVAKILETGRAIGLANHTLLLSRDGTEIPVADSGSPIFDSDGSIAGAVLVFRDQSNELLNRRITETRLSIVRFAASHTLADLLPRIVEECVKLLGAGACFCFIPGKAGSRVTLVLRYGPQGLRGTPVQPVELDEGRLAAISRDCIDTRQQVDTWLDAASPSVPGASGDLSRTRVIAVPVLGGDGGVAAIGAVGRIGWASPRELEVLRFFGEILLEMIEQKRMEEALSESERRYSEVFEGSRDGIVMTGRDGSIIDANSAYCEMLGYSLDELLTVGDIDPATPDLTYSNRGASGRHRPGTEVSGLYGMRLSRRDGTLFPVEMQSYYVRGEGGELRYCWSIVRDVTEVEKIGEESEKLRARLSQSQKLEAVGRLAGGVAHDFNNLLMGMINYAELCRENTATGNPIRDWLDEIVSIANRSSDLVRQLLAFARRQTISPKPVAMNDSVSSMLKMLRRLIGEDIDLVWVPGADVPPVLMDPSQLDQLLINLALNARDAIGGAGTLRMETKNTEVDEDYCRTHVDAVPGVYATLVVSDDGRGMDAETISHIFEPFFTTKGVGEGSGLGLATVHGIVRQNEGFIDVRSEPGVGTTFSVHFPRHSTAPAPLRRSEPVAQPPGGGETIMVVEDERSVRSTVEAFLISLGYRVVTAEGPEQALSLLDSLRGNVDLIVTDVVMPGMSVREFVERIRSRLPGIRCVYMSGYTSDVIVHRGILDDAVDFLAKPFTRDQLARKVREVLERR